MVRINSLALLALSASALAATTHNDRRGVEVFADPTVVSRSAPLMDLSRRQDAAPEAKKPDSPDVQKLKDAEKAISPELAQAKEDLKTARKAAEDSIPADLKTKEEDAKKALKDARKAAEAAIPADLKTKEEDAKKNLKTAREAAKNAINKDLKTKEEDAKKKVQTIFEALPDDKKKQLADNHKSLRAAKKAEKGAPAPAGAEAPAPPAAEASPAPAATSAPAAPAA